MNRYDVIVIGIGTMGVTTCAYLAQQGAKVLGLEQSSIPNDKASHSGYTRIIRKAYYEHSDYVPLLARSYELWKDVEEITSSKIYHQTGILYLGESSSPVLKGCLESSRLYHIPVHQWSETDTKSIFPQFTYPKDWISLWEPEAGYLDVHVAINSFFKTAVQAGATIHQEEQVLRWHLHNGIITLDTNRDQYQTSKLIFTGGAWTAKLLSSTNLPLKVTRQTLAWIPVEENSSFLSPEFPCWFIHDPNKGMYYGFPDSTVKHQDEPPGVKIGLHVQGLESDPDQIDRTIHIYDEETILHACQQYLPGLDATAIAYKTCMYTNTPDEHFILDFVPNTNQQVMVACGFSGHGFKFAPVIGEILTAMAQKKKPNMDTDFLNLARFKT